MYEVEEPKPSLCDLNVIPAAFPQGYFPPLNAGEDISPGGKCVFRDELSRPPLNDGGIAAGAKSQGRGIAE
jgi:hypothetical protein